MGAVPKRKVSRHRRGNRRRHQYLTAPQLWPVSRAPGGGRRKRRRITGGGFFRMRRMEHNVPYGASVVRANRLAALWYTSAANGVPQGGDRWVARGYSP